MAGRDVGAVEAVYWAKTGGFHSVEPSLEASAFLEGVPRGARELRFVAQAGGGFFTSKPGMLGGAKERRLELDAVVNCCHGGPGEDGTLQGALDLAEVPYTGPSAASAALGMDKLAFGAVVSAAGLPSLPRSGVLPGAGAPAWEGFGGPYIVKPRFGGSSIGIEIIEHWDDVQRYREMGGPHTARGLVVEPYVPSAYDVNVAVRSHPALELSLFERALRSSGSSPILSYTDKYLGGDGMVSAPRELPAQLPADLQDQLAGAAEVVASLTGARGVWRIDFLVDGDSERWWVNEVNTIPGSLAKYLWTGEAAVDFPTLLADMVDEALERPSAQWGSAGADGSALRSAAAIASKLG
jgi:D-alanine-D-alanine ligase